MPDNATSHRAATTFEPTAKGNRFTCGGCGHVFWQKFQLVYKPCPKCGQHVSSITRMDVKHRA